MRLVNFPQNAKIGFQGAFGAYSEMAIRALADKNEPKPIPFREFEDVCQALENGEIDFAALPIENALTGTIHQVMDLIFSYPQFEFIAQYNLRISHNLIVHPDAKIETINEVLSHPQGLLQCKAFLSNYPKWNQTVYFDTAGSVELISNTKDLTKAAIASKLAAKTYGMKILVEGIETNRRNYTRFALLRKKGPKSTYGSITNHALIFDLKHEPGTLVESLKLFQNYGLNLSKIESRPIHGKPFEYLFYLEVQDMREDRSIEPLLDEIQLHATEIRHLGSYPVWSDE